MLGFCRLAGVSATVALLAIGLAGCTVVVPKDEVAKAIDAQSQKNNLGASPAACPQDLTGEVGQSVRCEVQVDSQPIDIVATVSSIDGNTVNYGFKAEARPVSKQLLEKKVGELIAAKAGVTIESTSCSGDLQPAVGQTSNCVVTSKGQAVPFKVTVSNVDGGLINFKLDEA